MGQDRDPVADGQRQELQTFQGTDEVTSVALSADDGKFIATASYDNRAIPSEVDSGKRLQVCSGHTVAIDSVALKA